MKKLVVVAALFMFVCSGSFLVQANSSAQQNLGTTQSNDTVVTDTVQAVKCTTDTATVAE